MLSPMMYNSRARAPVASLPGTFYRGGEGRRGFTLAEGGLPPDLIPPQGVNLESDPMSEGIQQGMLGVMEPMGGMAAQGMEMMRPRGRMDPRVMQQLAQILASKGRR